MTAKPALARGRDRTLGIRRHYARQEPGYGNVDGAIGDRPNLLDPAILGRTINNPDTATQMLPRSALAFMRPSDSRGNLGHNVFRKDGIRNANASLARTWKVSGGKSLTFRVESINLLNTPRSLHRGTNWHPPISGRSPTH
jgi:hypothetical protein